ncbi:hypothetical protein KBC03_01105 [Patescibacteria group bacterium]|nr:hypothetical protein [Patescibacteria group bacterium]
MSNHKKTLLIFGNISAPIMTDRWMALIGGIQEILTKNDVILINATGDYLASYVETATACYAPCIQASEDSFVRHYTKLRKNFIMSDASYDTLMTKRINSMFQHKKPDIALCIGGYDDHSMQIFERCTELAIPTLGIPLFEGYGELIYETMVKEFGEFHSLGFPKTLDQYGERFTTLFTALSKSEEPFKTLPELITLALHECTLEAA